MELQVVNIKCSFFIDKPLRINERMKIINPYDNVKITIYNHSPNLINVTGIKSFEKLEIFKIYLSNQFSVNIIQERIDAIMLNYKSPIHKKINLNKLSNICSNIKNYNLDFNCELFNAPFLKSKSKNGTLLLFSSGSVQIMGVKRKRDIPFYQIFLFFLFTKYKKLYKQDK